MGVEGVHIESQKAGQNSGEQCSIVPRLQQNTNNHELPEKKHLARIVFQHLSWLAGGLESTPETLKPQKINLKPRG